MPNNTWGNAALAAYYEDKWNVYVLQGDVGRYIGITSNPEHRLRQHKNGHTESSRRLGNPSNLECILVIFIGDYITASKIERVFRRNINALFDTSINLIKTRACKKSDNELESRVRYILDYGKNG